MFYDFEASLMELGAAPKKKVKPAPKAKAPPKPKPAPKAKAPAKPKPAPKAKAPPKPKPVPKAKAPAKPKPAPKAKAPAKPKPAPKAKAPAKSKPAPKPKAPPKKAASRPVPKAPARAVAPRPRPVPGKSTPAPSRPALAASGLLRTSGSASLALVPATLRPAPPQADSRPPDWDMPEDSPESSESYDSPDSTEETSESEESDNYEEFEESEESDENESSENDDSGDMEWGTLQTTEAVEMQSGPTTARMVENIQATKKAARRLPPANMSQAEISERANKVLGPACKCAGLTPEDVRARLNARFIRRGYPVGTSDRLLADVSRVNQLLDRAAADKAALSGGIREKLARLAARLPDEHPTKLRANRMLLTLKAS